jgi:hypothetical protein
MVRWGIPEQEALPFGGKHNCGKRFLLLHDVD